MAQEFWLDRSYCSGCGAPLEHTRFEQCAMCFFEVAEEEHLSLLANERAPAWMSKLIRPFGHKWNNKRDSKSKAE